MADLWGRRDYQAARRHAWLWPIADIRSDRVALGSCVEEVGNEDFLDREAAVRQALLVMVTQNRVDSRAVRSHAVNQPVGTEKLAVSREQARQPRDHDSHVVERHAVLQLLGHG